MRNFAPYFRDITHLWPGGATAWEVDKLKLWYWTRIHFENAYRARPYGDEIQYPGQHTPRRQFFNVGNHDQHYQFIQDFPQFIKWIRDISNKTEYKFDHETPPLAWMAVLMAIPQMWPVGRIHIDPLSSDKDEEEIRQSTDKNIRAYGHDQQCRIILPLRKCDGETQSTVWWDLKDRHKYEIGSEEHVKAIRRAMSNAVAGEEGSTSYSFVSPEILDQFEPVAVQQLKGPAIINTTLPHQPCTNLDDIEMDPRVTFTFATNRPRALWQIMNTIPKYTRVDLR